MKKVLAVVLALLMIFGCFSVISFAEEATDHLTEVPDGYVGVYTKDDLDYIRLDMSGKYILMNDIVFEDKDFEKGGDFYNSGKGWEPIGTSSTKFKGIFDGNGYTIKNLYTNSPEQECVGLFGYISGATINNVILQSLNITGGRYTGGVAGRLYQGGTISYCVVHGVIQGKQDVGGITGSQIAPSGSSSYSTYIKNCINTATVQGDTFVGGIVGYSSSTYSTSYSNGFSSVEYCSNSGTVIANNSSVGGIAGRSTGSTSNSFTYCFNSGDVSASSHAGGLIGNSDSNNTKVKHCYSVGEVTAASNFGGCFGISPNKATFCYYLDESVVEPTCMSGTAKSADQLRRATAYEQWDFTNVWTMNGREDYPYPELINTPLVLPGDFHEHDYKSEVTTPATHLKTGVMTYTCECGDSYTEEIEKTPGHSYTSKVTTPATHLKTGVMTYTCECGDSYTEEIEKTPGHSYTSKVTTPATHTSTGVMTYTCECGDSYTEEIEKTPGHSYTSKVTTPATHLKTGVMTYTCECGDSYTEIIDKLADHNHNAVVIEPTCTEGGYTTYTCACGDSYVSDYVDALGHTDGDWVVTKPATTTQTGTKTQSCSVCGKLLKTETIPMLPAKVHSVSVSGVSLDYKSTGTIATAINADTGAKYTVTYSSSNSTVASVDVNGKVTAGKTGNATITCTVTDEYGNVVTDTCEVKVSYNWWQWIIVIVLFGWIWY